MVLNSPFISAGSESGSVAVKGGQFWAQVSVQVLSPLVVSLAKW